MLAAPVDTTVWFAKPGSYTLRLSADDGIGATTDDEVVITVK